MDERILVEVYVPAVLQGMEVLLPAQAKLGVVHCFVSRLLETAWHLEKGSLKAVSYTHLDVYKRQHHSCMH